MSGELVKMIDAKITQKFKRQYAKFTADEIMVLAFLHKRLALDGTGRIGRESVRHALNFGLMIRKSRGALNKFKSTTSTHCTRREACKFARGAETENRNKPDFLFPRATQYRSTTFPSERLTMLGAKSSCKDRWRQVLSEAQEFRISIY